MNGRFLDKAIAKARERVAARKSAADIESLRARADSVRRLGKPHGFRDALSTRDRVNIIAEIKRASPSRGVINADVDAAEMAQAYESGGAAAVSVLTETEFFGGSMIDLFAVYQKVRIPILRKDFIVDEYQIVEAAAFGADAVLLIVAALNENELRSLYATATDLGLDVLVEVHDRAELEIAVSAGAEIIGVNNRDLNSLEVSLDVSRELSRLKPKDCTFVAESGISAKGEIDELRHLGFDAFLIGETLMRSDDPAVTLRGLMK